MTVTHQPAGDVPFEYVHSRSCPREFTARPGVSDVVRAMLMGNALVVGLVSRTGEALYRNHLEIASRPK